MQQSEATHFQQNVLCKNANHVRRSEAITLPDQSVHHQFPTFAFNSSKKLSAYISNDAQVVSYDILDWHMTAPAAIRLLAVARCQHPIHRHRPSFGDVV